MKTFILILLFGKTIALTPNEIDINEHISLSLGDPISAITSGATIQVDVSNTMVKEENEGIIEFRDRVKKHVPPGSLRGVLLDRAGNQLALTYSGGIQYSDNNTFLVLHGRSGIPAKREYIKLDIYSDVAMTGVKVYWKNYKH